MSSQKIIKKRFNYTENDFKSAVQYCKAGGKLSSAAKLHNIPVSTLSRKLNAGIDCEHENLCLCSLLISCCSITDVTKPGRKPWICRQTEENLAEWITEGGVLGAPKSRSDIKLAAWGLSSKNSDEKGGNFGSSGPSNGWLNKFFRRHPEIKKRKAEGLSSASAAVNFHNIQGWFSFVQDWLITNGFFDILNDPSRIINMDEAGFEHYPSSGMVFVHKSQKDVYNVARNAKEQTTVLWAFQASGEALKPHIVFAGKRLTNELKTATPDSVTIGLTESGWMTQVHFAHYLENILVPQLRAKGVQFPVIVFLDGHSSHDSIEVGNF